MAPSEARAKAERSPKARRSALPSPAGPDKRHAWQKPPPTFAEWSKSDEARESACAVRYAGRVWVEYGDAEYLFIEDSLSTATPDEVRQQALATRAQCGYATTTAYSESVWASPMLSFPDDDDDAEASDSDGGQSDANGDHDAGSSRSAPESPAGPDADEDDEPSSSEASDSEDDRLPPPPISRDEFEASMYVSIFPESSYALDALQREHDAAAGKRAREGAALGNAEAKKAKLSFSFTAPPHASCAVQELRPSCGGHNHCSA